MSGLANSKAVPGLVAGIVGIVFALCCAPVGIVLGIVGAVLGHLAGQEIRASGGAQSGAGQAQAALITGIVAVVLSVASCGIGLAANVGSGFGSFFL